MLSCDEIELDLPLMIDGELDEERVELIESHLPTCPLCRDALDDFRAMKFGLARESFVEMPSGLENQIKMAISDELSPLPLTVKPAKVSFSEKISHWMMPFSVGTVAASLVAATFFLAMLSGLRPSVDRLQAREMNNMSDVLASNSNSAGSSEVDISEVPFAISPPEVNPTGALVALTSSLIRGEMNDEEVVLVADVFDSGIAKIAGVVEGPSDESDLLELQKAFEADPEEAPFLPTKVGQSSDRVRVVFKIHSVDVDSK